MDVARRELRQWRVRGVDLGKRLRIDLVQHDGRLVRIGEETWVLIAISRALYGLLLQLTILLQFLLEGLSSLAILFSLVLQLGSLLPDPARELPSQLLLGEQSCILLEGALALSANRAECLSQVALGEVGPRRLTLLERPFLRRSLGCCAHHRGVI